MNTLTFLAIALVICLFRVTIGGEDWYDVMFARRPYDWFDDIKDFFRAVCLGVVVVICVSFLCMFSRVSPTFAESQPVASVAEAPVKQKQPHKNKGARKHKKVSHPLKH